MQFYYRLIVLIKNTLALKANFKLLVFVITILAFFDGRNPAIAQETSVMGRFSIENSTGCAPLEVNITELDNFGANTSRQYWYENKDNPPVLSKTHTYTEPGEYYLVQLVGANVPQKEDSIKVTVYEPSPPDFIIHNCDDHVVRVEVTDDTYDRYRVDFTATDSRVVNPGTINPEFNYGVAGDYPIVVTGLYDNAVDNCGVNTKTVSTIDNIVSPVLNSIEVNNESSDGSALLTFSVGEGLVYTLEVSTNDAVGFEDLMEISGSRENITGLNTLANYYCFRIRTFDACNNVFIYSNILCSTVIDVEVGNGQNDVIWNTEPGLTNSYKVLRNGEVQTEINDPFANSFADSNILCGNDYCYEVQAIYNTGTSLSIDTCIVADKTGDLLALADATSTVVNENVVLNWTEPIEDIQLSQYLVQRSVAGRPFNTIAHTLDTNHTDDDVTFRQSLKYRIVYQDNCGNSSIPSPITIPMVLQVRNVNGNVVDFEWNKYENWVNGVRTYFLERLDDSGAVIEEFSVLSGRSKSITFSTDDDQPKNIRVRAESLDSTPLISYSNVRTVSVNPLIILPTAFTPDGDGLNDEFKVIGTKVFNFNMQVFSRWGDLVFFSDDATTGWNGNISGNKAPQGTYVYRLNFEDATGRTFNPSGAVVLLRTQ